MSGSSVGRRLAIAAALAGFAVLQGCAVVTGIYVPDRSPTTSHSMVSRFDKRFSQPVGGTTVSSSLHMPREREGGLFYFRY
jgi:hypothetical protein